MRDPLRSSRITSSTFEYTRRSYTSALRAGVLAVAVVSLAACGGAKSDDTALKTDTALSRDLAMAASDTNAKPKLQDEPAPAPAKPAPVATKPAPKPTPKPAAPKPTPTVTPAPAPAPAAPTTGVIAAGSTLRFESNAKVCSNTIQVGEKFTAGLSQSISGTNGAELPAGATGTFEVTEKKIARNNGDTTYLRVKLISVSSGGQSYDVDATVQTAATTRVRSAKTSDDVKKVGAGAVIGAIAGQVIGKNTKGTVIGAAAGAAAGGVVAAQTADYDTCLNSGAAIAVRLDTPTTIKIRAN